VNGAWGAAVRLVYPTEPGTCAAIGTLPKGSPFDVLVNVGIGPNLMHVVDAFDLFVAVRDLTASCTVARLHKVNQLRARRGALTQTLEVPVDAGWDAEEGAVLEIVATLKVTAGIHSTYSFATSPRFIVVAAEEA
jgi:hypothetical protein